MAMLVSFSLLLLLERLSVQLPFPPEIFFFPLPGCFWVFSPLLVVCHCDVVYFIVLAGSDLSLMYSQLYRLSSPQSDSMEGQYRSRAPAVQYPARFPGSHFKLQPRTPSI